MFNLLLSTHAHLRSEIKTNNKPFSVTIFTTGSPKHWKKEENCKFIDTNFFNLFFNVICDGQNSL